MNILITAGASLLAQDLAETFSQEHTVRLTDVDGRSDAFAVSCAANLGHDAKRPTAWWKMWTCSFT